MSDSVMDGWDAANLAALREGIADCACSRAWRDFRDGIARAAANDLRGAEPLLRAAGTHDPYLGPPARMVLGRLLARHGQLAESARELRSALRVAPTAPQLHTSLGHTLMIAGDYRAGWEELEWRRRLALGPLPVFPALDGPEWRGGPIRGRKLLVHAEQGLGDCLMFARYLPLLAQHGARVILACERPLIPLLRDMPGLAATVPARELPFPPYDAWILLGSVPRLFGTTPETIPAPSGYVSAPSARRASWARLLPEGRRVGLVWAGNPLQEANAERSIPFPALAPLLAVRGFRFLGLQVGERNADAAGAVIDLSAQLTDFAETAAVIANLDLVVSVCTSVAHLAGAMGKPCWVLLPHAPDWRWMLGREDSPWYKSIRLFRQERPGEWAAPVAAAAAALHKRRAQHRPS
jgi:hypothetical protein